jgi:predicted ATPase
MIGGVARRVSSPVLVGRDGEVAQLRAVLERAAAGRPATVVVAGEAGVGKTRLVAELVGQAGELGAVALTGGCLDVGEGVLTYAPLVEALRPLVGVLDPGELDRVLGGARAELARLVPELGPQAGGRPAEAPLAPTRLFELLLGVLHRLAEGGPVLLVVEDLHWADQSTRDLLGFLYRNLRGGVALVLTYRSDELHRRHPLGPFLAELDRSGRAERLEPTWKGSGCRRPCGSWSWPGWRHSRSRPSGCWRWPRSPAPGSTTSSWPPWPARTPRCWCGCCARR